MDNVRFCLCVRLSVFPQIKRTFGEFSEFGVSGKSLKNKMNGILHQGCALDEYIIINISVSEFIEIYKQTSSGRSLFKLC